MSLIKESEVQAYARGVRDAIQRLTRRQGGEEWLLLAVAGGLIWMLWKNYTTMQRLMQE